MLVYLVVLVVVVAIARIAELAWKSSAGRVLPRKFSWGAVAVGVTLAAVSSLRWEVGTDYKTYVRLYPRYVREFQEDFQFFGEPGIRFIAWVSSKINDDSAMMFAISAAITVTLFVRTIWRWAPAFAFGIAIYFLSGAWHGSFNVVRQYIACSILFAGHRFIIQRRFVAWFLIVLLATMFHTSAVVAILMYFVPTKNSSVKVQLTILTLGIISLFGMGSVVEWLEAETDDSTRWGSEYAERGISPIRVAFSFVPILLYWLLNVREKVSYYKASFYVNMLTVYAAIHLATLNSTLVARFLIYPLPFLAIGLAYVTFVDNGKERLLIRSFLLFLFGLFMYFEVASTGSLSSFKWILDRPSI